MKYSNKEMSDIVTSEGLDYAILCYTSYKNIEDEHLADLWKEADKILTEIELILEKAHKDCQ